MRNHAKIVAVLACALGIGAFSAWATEGTNPKPHYAPGTYLAASEGIGTVLVAVTVDEDTILDIRLDVSQESPDVGGEAANILRDQILHDQSVKVDSVTGASTTSKAVKEAVERALRKATLSAVDANQKEEIANLNSNIEQLQAMVDSLKDENESLMKANAEKDEENVFLRNENESRRSENEGLKAENEKLSEQNADLEQKLSVSDKEKAKTEEETKAKSKDKTEKETEAKTEEETEAKTEAETETKAETETEASAVTTVMEETQEETSSDLVSMQPVEAPAKPVEKEVTNSPIFQPYYIGTTLVWYLQDALNSVGYYIGEVDGILGADTTEQLLNYQLANGLESNGTITPETVKYLLGFDAPASREARTSVVSNATMKEGNMLDFQFEDLGTDGYNYNVAISITNNAPSTVTGISIDCVWFNYEGTRIMTNKITGNGKLKSGATETTSTVLSGSELVEQVASMGVGAYTYTMRKPDKNGYSTYHVNLLTGEVRGS